MKNREKIIKKLEAMAKRMRKKVLDMALAAGANSSHFGGGLSIVDLTATLYGEIMNLDPKNPEWEDRDRFILSKGHGVLGYYTALSEIGYIPENDLETFEKNSYYLSSYSLYQNIWKPRAFGCNWALLGPSWIYGCRSGNTWQI